MSDATTDCASLVERADPDRFRAAMAAPVAARRILFPLYAFNAEVARAPWVTAEPMIAEMRLQWWRDTLADIAAGRPVRRHEVVTPLAAILAPDEARILDELVAARSWDIYTDPFSDLPDLVRYLDHTSGHLTVVAARCLGVAHTAPLRDVGHAAGLANWFLAVPDWLARGRQPLPDPRPAAIAALAGDALDRLSRARRAPIPKAARPALLPAWQAGYVLRRAASDPEQVLAGSLRPSPARSQAMLIRQALTGRF